MATTYSNPCIIGNTAAPPLTLNHNAVWPEGLAKDNAGNIYEVRGWDEPHYDIARRDPATGNVVWTSRQILSGHEQHAICVEPDFSWAYTTGSSGQNGQMRARIWRFDMTPGIPYDQVRKDFTSAGYAITVYDYGQIPTTGADQEPLHSIVVAGGSLWVTDSFGGRLLKYDKVSGVQQKVISALPNARGLTVDSAGNLWVGYNGNQVRSYTSAGVLINTTTLSGVTQITCLSVGGTKMAVAHLGGVQTYTVASGQLTTQLSTYGQPFRPGDNAPDRVREVVGMVQLNDGSIIFSDRVGFNGRVQKIGGWVHLGLEFTAGATFHPDIPERVITSSRMVYSVAPTGEWGFVGNGQTESFTNRTYFGHYLSTHGGPPKIVKHGNERFFYFPSGSSLAIYRIIENSGRGPSLQLCSCLCACGQPGVNGTHTEEPWLDVNRVAWQWTDPVGDGLIRSADQVIYSAQNPQTYCYMSTCSVDNTGTIWIRELDADCLTRIPLNSLNALGNPVYRWQDRIKTVTRQQVQDALQVPKIEFQDINRADGDVYFGVKIQDNPNYPTSGQWMGCNAMGCCSPEGVLRWAKVNAFWQIGVAAIDNQGGGGYVSGSNDAGGPGTIYHFDKDGNQLKKLRPDPRYGDSLDGPNYPSGGLDSHQSVNVMRDPRDGQVKVFAADNLNQRVIVYSIADSGITPPPTTMTVNLAWDAPNPAPASYAIYQHGTTAVKVGTSNTTTGSVPGNEGDVFSVRSVASNGKESADSNKVTVNKPVNPPTNLRIESVT